MNIILKFKKGRKAFYSGVNVLDSNPKMSKAASKKVKKALEGTKINTFLKIGNWLNSDGGKAISGTLMNGLSAGFQAKQMTDAINEYELASKAKLRKLLNISSKDYVDKALLTMNPNENLSQVVLLKRAYDIGLQEAQKKYDAAKEEVNLDLVDLKLAAYLKNQANLGGLLQGISSLGNYFINKSATKVDNGAPATTGNSYLDAIKFLQQNGIV